MKKLCIANPVVRCSDESMSPTNARNGSMEILMEASRIHSITVAKIQVGELVIMASAREAKMAPVRK
ncbi:MAG: hypothetical protein BWY89_01816 [Bacteroidetes bacterium ADurb.BinA012]|nr:MAG: hypothetical protein BWY89_01816 [Bacteroidetes bacterium ADurb.BinA012]